MGDVVQPGGGGTEPNLYQRFYRSRAFDLVCGAVPAALIGGAGLVFGGYLIYSNIQQPVWDGLFVGLSMLLFGLATLGTVGCTALLVSIFARTRLSRGWRAVCTGLLCLHIGLALVGLGMLTEIMLISSLDLSTLYFSFLIVIALATAFAAFKQIRLLSSGGDGAVLRR